MCADWLKNYYAKDKYLDYDKAMGGGIRHPTNEHADSTGRSVTDALHRSFNAKEKNGVLCPGRECKKP